MAWRRPIALVLLLAITGLPAGGTLCAIVCDASTKAGSHHAATAECEAAARSSSGPQIGGLSEHDCSSHDAVPQMATTAAERADLIAGVAPAAVDFASPGELSPFHDDREWLDDSAPPGTAPPTVRPVVLRV